MPLKAAMTFSACIEYSSCRFCMNAIARNEGTNTTNLELPQLRLTNEPITYASIPEKGRFDIELVTVKQ